MNIFYTLSARMRSAQRIDVFPAKLIGRQGVIQSSNDYLMMSKRSSNVVAFSYRTRTLPSRTRSDQRNNVFRAKLLGRQGQLQSINEYLKMSALQ